MLTVTKTLSYSHKLLTSLVGAPKKLLEGYLVTAGLTLVTPCSKSMCTLDAHQINIDACIRSSNDMICSLCCFVPY